MSGWCLKLHCCTPGLVRTSAGSTPYKGTTSPIPIEPLLLLLLLFLWCNCPNWAKAASKVRFLDHKKLDTHTHTHTPGTTPLNEPVADADTYTHKRLTSIPSAGFELAISAIERPQTYTLDLTATGLGIILLLLWRWASTHSYLILFPFCFVDLVIVLYLSV